MIAILEQLCSITNVNVLLEYFIITSLSNSLTSEAFLSSVTALIDHLTMTSLK